MKKRNYDKPKSMVTWFTMGKKATTKKLQQLIGGQNPHLFRGFQPSQPSQVQDFFFHRMLCLIWLWKNIRSWNTTVVTQHVGLKLRVCVAFLLLHDWIPYSKDPQPWWSNAANMMIQWFSEEKMVDSNPTARSFWTLSLYIFHCNIFHMV